MKEDDFSNLKLEDHIEMDKALQLMDIHSPSGSSRDGLRLGIEGRLFDYGFIVAKLGEESGIPFAEMRKPIVRPLLTWLNYRIGATVERHRILIERRKESS